VCSLGIRAGLFSLDKFAGDKFAGDKFSLDKFTFNSRFGFTRLLRLAHKKRQTPGKIASVLF
jgi:hypothetical protein